MKLPRLPRAVLAGSLALVLGASMVACGSDSDDQSNATGNGSSTSSSASTAPVMKTVKLGIDIPNYAFFMSTYLAEEKGWLAQEGIEKVDITETDQTITGVIGGSLDIALGDSTGWFTAAAKSNQPVKFIGVLSQTDSQILGASPKSGIKTPAQLKGKTVTPGELGGQDEYQLRKMLTAIGVDAKDVRMVPTGGGDVSFQAVLNGKVDAGVIRTRHISPLEQAGGTVLLNKTVASPQNGFAVRESMLTTNRPTLIAFLTAQIKALQYIHDPAHKDEILALMEKRGFKITPAQRDTYYVFQEGFSPELGFDPAAMDALVADSKAVKLVDQDLDWRKYTDVSAIHEAQDALKIPQRPVSLGQ